MKSRVVMIVAATGLLFSLSDVAAQSTAECSNEKEVADARAEFIRLRDLRSLQPTKVTDDEFRAAAQSYLVAAEACYIEKYGPRELASPIDEGGVWLEPPSEEEGFVTFGTKWGADSPFTGGTDVPGPGTPGGEVSYSFMPDGVDMSAEGADANVAISSLPTFAACFITEIENGFDAWAAVANITFVEVADDGLPFNTGDTGDIRIGAHTFDGASGTLAHGFYPPPNGATAAGDIHFDREENWDCTDDGATLDFGIVAAHEIGHAIGLGHETVDVALMNPFYNPVVDMPLVDDIEGIESIYGSTAATCEVGMSADTYSGSEVVTIAVLSISNATGGFVATEWKAWLEDPSGNEFNFLSIGADSSFALPASFFADLADPDIPFFPADTQALGVWKLGCRVENPATGEDYAADIVSFETLP